MEEDSLNKSSSSDDTSHPSLRERFELKKKKLQEISRLVGIIEDNGQVTMYDKTQDMARKLLKCYEENKELRNQIKILRESPNVPRPSNPSDDQRLKEKYTVVVNQLHAVRHELSTAQKTIEDMKAVVAREIGPDDPKSAGWQGRAADIAQLRQRIRVLESSAVHANAPVVVVDHRRASELCAETDNLRIQLLAMTRAKLALKSRVDTLEQRLAQSKEDVRKLLDKNHLNDQIIEKLESYLQRD